MAPTSKELPDEYIDQTPTNPGSSHHHPHEGEYSDTYQPPPTDPSSSRHHPHEREYLGTYQTSTNPNPPHHHVPQLGYPHQPAYYTPYNQSTAQRNMVSTSYSYQSYSSVSGPSTTQLAETPYPASPYVGNYGAQSQPLDSHRVDPFYYTQSTPSPTTSITEGTYSHQYMPFRQTHIGLSHPETGQPSSSQLSLALETPQRLVSSDQTIGERRARGEEVNYGSLASNYRHIISTVSQVPSPSTDSPVQSFETPVVDDMLHRAVEGLRYLDPTRAEQYVYPGEFGVQPVASGAVAPEGSSDTVFVRYYEDGKTEVAPTTNLKKKKRERKGATQCASCHVTTTPEWRRGPLGPRTLCNACGLVYAKLMKKRAKEEEKPSPGGSPRRARPKGKSRELTEESEEDREQGSDDTLPPMAGPSGMSGGGYPQ